MPWKVVKRKSRWCVEKVDGGEVPGGCHDSRSEAVDHQKALYAGEASIKASAQGGTVLVMKTPITMIFFSAIPSLATSTTNHTAALLEPGVTAAVTVTVTDDDAVSEEAGAPSDFMWEGIIAFEGKVTDDGRYLMPNGIDHRELPLPIMAQTVTAEGHMGAELAAKIEEIWWQESETELGVMEIWGRGPFDSGEAGQEAARLVDEEFLTGMSIDFAPSEAFLLDPETKEPVDMEGLDLFDMLMGDYITGFKGSIMGATLVPFPAFDGSKVQTVTAGGAMMRVIRPDPITASAAGMAPIAPPEEWFEMPEPDIPCPLTVTEDGRVYGHIAVWGQCHTGFDQVCKNPPRSRAGYSHFHLGEIETAEGTRLAVGRITVGNKGHAPISYNAPQAVEHYDHTGCVGAFVRAKDGRLGIWVSGAVRSDAPAEKIRDMMANPPSGDWRAVNGSLELQGILSVPIPGFPVPRSEVRLVASGSSGEVVEALVAMGYGNAPLGPKAIQRKRGVLRARLSETLGTQRRKKTRAEQRLAAMADRE